MSEFADVFANAFIRIQEELQAAKQLIEILQTENNKLKTENEELKKKKIV